MPRVIALLLGLAAGVAAAGLAAGLLIPQLPPDRSHGAVWTAAAVLIVSGVGVAFVMTRPRRS